MLVDDRVMQSRSMLTSQRIQKREADDASEPTTMHEETSEKH